MTSNPVAVIDPAQLPVEPETCQPVYPNRYLRVNTIFEVAWRAGLRTAWSDRHPAYQILSGPSGTAVRGVPAIFGTDFQTVSTAEKLATSDGLTGGYLADGMTPGPLLSRALDFINGKVGAIEQAIQDNGLSKDTVVILSAKHGQSPQQPSALTRIDGGQIITALDNAWLALIPAPKLRSSRSRSATTGC